MIADEKAELKRLQQRIFQAGEYSRRDIRRYYTLAEKAGIE